MVNVSGKLTISMSISSAFSISIANWSVSRLSRSSDWSVANRAPSMLRLGAFWGLIAFSFSSKMESMSDAIGLAP